MSNLLKQIEVYRFFPLVGIVALIKVTINSCNKNEQELTLATLIGKEQREFTVCKFSSQKRTENIMVNQWNIFSQDQEKLIIINLVRAPGNNLPYFLLRVHSFVILGKCIFLLFPFM
jgi:hypothetical protein